LTKKGIIGMSYPNLLWSTASGRSRILGVVVVLLCIISAHHFRVSNYDPEAWNAVGVLLVALVVARWAFRSSPGATFLRRLPTAPLCDSPRLVSRPRIWTIGLVAMILLTLVNLLSTAVVSAHVQFALLVVGVVCIPWGLMQPETLPVRSWRWPMVLLLGIILLGFGLRLVSLGELVPYFVDEGNFAAHVNLLRADGGLKPLLHPFSSFIAFPWIYPYLQWWTADGMLGRNLDGLRLVSVFFGTLTIPALYLLARQLVDQSTALLAALLLAVFPPHLAFSRLGMNNIADPLFGTLALAFLVRSWQRQDTRNLVLAGVMLGLTQYFYEGGRLVFPAVMIAGVGWYGLHRPLPLKQMLRRLWRTFILAVTQLRLTRPLKHLFTENRRLLLVALVFMLPLYITWIWHNFPLTPRLTIAGVGSAQDQFTIQLSKQNFGLVRQIITPFLVYVHVPEELFNTSGNPPMFILWYYGSRLPMVMPWLVPFFLLGLLTLVWHPRRPAILALGAILLTSLGAILISNNAIYSRYVVIFPLVVLLVAVGVRVALSWLLASRLGRWLPRLMVGLGLLTAVLQVHYYYGTLLPWYNLSVRGFRLDSEDAIRRAIQYPAAWPIFIVSSDAIPQNVDYTLDYYADGYGVAVIQTEELRPELFAVLPPEQGVLFFISPNNRLARMALEANLPLTGPFFSPFDTPMLNQYALYVVPPVSPGFER
jgi:hypothetical protein